MKGFLGSKEQKSMTPWTSKPPKDIFHRTLRLNEVQYPPTGYPFMPFVWISGVRKGDTPQKGGDINDLVLSCSSRNQYFLAWFTA